MAYIAHPTNVLKQFLEREQGLKPRMEFTLGRLSMALEVITVVKTLEDELVPMLSLQRQEIISVLQTLLVDQGLAESAMEWYEALTLWRQPVFETDASREDTASVGRQLEALVSAAASQGGGLQHAKLLAEGTRALHGDDQSLALPSVESGEQPAEEDQTMLSGSDEVLDDTDESRAAFLQESRNRRRTELQQSHDRSEPLPETADPSA